jgi:hypothetical protein
MDEIFMNRRAAEFLEEWLAENAVRGPPQLQQIECIEKGQRDHAGRRLAGGRRRHGGARRRRTQGGTKSRRAKLKELA